MTAPVMHQHGEAPTLQLTDHLGVFLDEFCAAGADHRRAAGLAQRWEQRRAEPRAIRRFDPLRSTPFARAVPGRAGNGVERGGDSAHRTRSNKAWSLDCICMAAVISETLQPPGQHRRHGVEPALAHGFQVGPRQGQRQVCGQVVIGHRSPIDTHHAVALQLELDGLAEPGVVADGLAELGGDVVQAGHGRGLRCHAPVCTAPFYKASVWRAGPGSRNPRRLPGEPEPAGSARVAAEAGCGRPREDRRHGSTHFARHRRRARDRQRRRRAAASAFRAAGSAHPASGHARISWSLQASRISLRSRRAGWPPCVRSSRAFETPPP